MCKRSSRRCCSIACSSSGVEGRSFDQPHDIVDAQLAHQTGAVGVHGLGNSLPGVEPVKSLKSAQAAAGRIWNRIQALGENPQPQVPTKAPSAKPARRVAPSKPQSTKKATRANKATKAPRKATRSEEHTSELQ